MPFSKEMKNLIPILFLGLFVLPLKAQDKLSPFSYGVKFGLSVSELKGAEDLLTLRPSFLFGIQSEYKFNTSLSLQPELIYSRQGATNSGRFDQIVFDNSLRLDYISLPLLAKYYITKGLAIEFGPQIGVLVNAQYKSISGAASEIVEIFDDFKSMDFLINAGVSYRTEWGFTAGARYGIGLINVHEGDNYGGGSLRNAVFQLNFGYFF